MNSTLRPETDAIIVGGSLSGLLAARAIAKAGFRVKIFEEDLEIGLPERCDGLVSMRCLETIGIAPTNSLVQNRIKGAILHSPSGLKAEISAKSHRLLVLDRRRFDLELARKASKSGAEIDLGQRVANIVEKNGVVNIYTNYSSQTARWIVNASGYSSLPRRVTNTLQAAKFEVYGDWFDPDKVEIFFDQNKAPGFFIWVIPINGNKAKVGVAGRGVNQFKILDQFVNARGGIVIKKTAAQIVIGGPIRRFVSGHVVSVGDAAGQAKPTTGGGIFCGGVGGLLAGRYIADSLTTGDSSRVEDYERSWRRYFGREFDLLLRVRRMLGRFDNDKIDKVIEAAAASEALTQISLESDFDFHALAFLKALGLRNALNLAGILAGDILDNFRSLLGLTNNNSND